MKNSLKKIVLSTLLLLLPLTGCSTTEETNKSNANDSTELIVATFNIDNKTPEISVESQRELLSEAGVEVYGIQEVFQNTKRYEIRDNYDPLVDFQKDPYKSSYFGESVPFGGGGYGNAIISKYNLSQTSVTQLYGTETAPADLQKQFLEIYNNVDYKDEDSIQEFKSVWRDGGLVAQGAIEPRSYSRAVFEKDGKEIAFYVTHLSVESFDVRTKQLDELKTALDNDTVEYKIIVGDFNTDYGINEYNIFKDSYKLANGNNGVWYETMAEEDEARNSLDTSLRVKFLDNVIVSNNMDIKDVKVIETDLSDHYPLVVRLILK